MWFEKAKQLISKVEGDIGFLVKNLATGETFAYRDDEVFPSASTIKVPILWALNDEAAEGRLDLNMACPVPPSEVVDGAGIVKFLSGNLQYTLLDHATLMIDLSDNTSTNQIIAALGMDKINAKFKDLGLKETVLGRIMMDFDARDQGRDNFTSCRDMLLIFNTIHDNPEKYAPALKILKQQILNYLLPHLIYPKDFKFAHKTGGLPSVRNDVGIMYLSVPVFVAFFAKNLKIDIQAVKLANEIGLLIYNEYR